MYNRPREARHLHWIVPADSPGGLLLDERIDQHLEGSLGFSNELIVFCA